MMEPVAWRLRWIYPATGQPTSWIATTDKFVAVQKERDGLEVEPLVPASRLSDAEARIAELTKWRDEWKDMATELKGLVEEWQARAEAAEALLKEAAESDNSLLGKLKVMRGVYAMQGEQYTSRALHNIITEFEATRAAHDKIGGK